MKKRRHTKHYRHIRNAIVICISAGLVLIGLAALWVATLKMPDLTSFEDVKVVNSTKIYDRTGTVLLYDTGTDVKRTTVPLSAISPFIQEGTIAIEDSNFYNNIGIEPTSILRALLTDVVSGGLDQGASTITQQVIKNSLLTQDKTFSRKIEELVLAIKLTRTMSKDQILETYLNETNYGGTIYGVEEASQDFFGKSASDVDLAQAAYIAAIPQAPSYYSPYGPNVKELDVRQQLVLQRMKDLGIITAAQYQSASTEQVQFLSQSLAGIRAPHFVMFVINYLVQKYGEDAVDSGGLKVITTLDYNMQQKAEDVVSRFAPNLQSQYHASSTAIVAIDPTSGDILTMVGSQNYFDNADDGSFNDALALRQPGSTFKPFVYSTLFKKGYTPETILFDTPMQFSTECTPEGQPIDPTASSSVCYSPVEYDNTYPGPMPIRQALAQSRNIPAVQALYLAGIPDSIQTAHDLGITSLNDPNRYGLTLVLGGGEVSLLDLTSAYGVFANDGVRNPYRSVLEVNDASGNVLEKATTTPTQVLDPMIARQISSILSDNSVRMTDIIPIANAIGRTVAIKTGTTNNYRDVWTEGYTPDLVVGAWAGNNNDSPMTDEISTLIITPIWGAFMSEVAGQFPPESFKAPPPPLTTGKPVLRGIWQGGVSYTIDTVSGKLATQYTPPETQKEVVIPDVHSILYWVNKDDPLGPPPTDPSQDPQFANWEYGVQQWLKGYKTQNPGFEQAAPPPPTATDDIHVPANFPKITITSPSEGSVIDPQALMTVHLQAAAKFPLQKTDVYLNGKYVMTSSNDPLNFSFIPADVSSLSATDTLSVTLYDSVYNQGQASVDFSVPQ